MRYVYFTLRNKAGHWFGLFHTFQDSCSYPNDLVKDTPPQKEPSYFCPKYFDKSCLEDDFDESHLAIFKQHDDDPLIEDTPSNFMDYLVCQFSLISRMMLV
jgi:hypothetical protein